MTTSVPPLHTRAGDAVASFAQKYAVLLTALVIAVGLAISTDTFLTPGNLSNLLDQAAVIGLLTCGATIVIISGAFDLSLGGVLALSGIAAVLGTQAGGVVTGFAAGAATGLALGVVNGLMVTITRVHSFIATLAMSIIYQGLAIVITGGVILYPPEADAPWFRMFTWPTMVGISAAGALFVVVALVMSLLLSFTTFGRRVYAVGGNEHAARLSGIRVPLVRVSVFALAGLCAALAGLILASRAGGAQPSLGSGLELTAIAAAIVGGTSVSGGVGAIWRGVVGVFLLVLIGNGFNLLGLDTTFQTLVQGGLILAAVTIDQALRRRKR